MAQTTLGRTLRTALGTDWAGVRWILPARIAVAATIAVAIALTIGDVGAAIPLSLGLLITGTGDPRGALPLRLRGMALAALGMALATEIGLRVAGDLALHVATAVAVAAICGYVGRFGPRAALAGMVSLVMFAIYSGAPEPLGASVETGGLVLVGGAIAAAVALAPLLAGRMGGVRVDVAIAYRSLGFALRDDPQWHRAGGPARALDTARERIAGAGPTEATAAWFDDLTDGLDGIRLTMLGLQSERHGSSGPALGRLVPAVAAFALAGAAAIELEARRGRVTRASDRLGAALQEARRELPERFAEALHGLERERARITGALESPFPLGRHGTTGAAPRIGLAELHAALRHPDPDRMYLRHAIRLAIVMGFATALTYLVPIPHAAWYPMTIAWVMKPDYAATVPRLTARTIGVMLGALAMGLLLLATGGGEIALLVGTGIAGLLFLVFVVPNYVIGSFGITAIVVGLLFADADPTLDTVPAQIGCAAAAGLTVALVARVWPTRTTLRIAAELAILARSLARYADVLRQPGDADPPRRRAALGAVDAARGRSAAIVVAALHEPAPHRVAAAAAAQILRDLDDAAAIAVAIDLGVHDTSDGVDEQAIAALDELADRLERVHDTGRCEPASPWRVETRLARHAADAGLALNVAVR